jgi:hypothetical protein
MKRHRFMATQSMQMDDPLVDANREELFEFIRIENRFYNAINDARQAMNDAVNAARGQRKRDLNELRARITVRIEEAQS